MFLRQIGRPAATRPNERQANCSRRMSLSWMPREAPGMRSMAPLRLQGTQMFFGGVRRLEPQGAGRFPPGWAACRFPNGILNELEDLGLAGSKVRHASPVYVASGCYYIQSLGAGKSLPLNPASAHRRHRRRGEKEQCPSSSGWAMKPCPIRSHTHSFAIEERHHSVAFLPMRISKPAASHMPTESTRRTARTRIVRELLHGRAIGKFRIQL